MGIEVEEDLKQTNMAIQDIKKDNFVHDHFQQFLFSQSKDIVCREPVLKPDHMVDLKIKQQELLKTVSI